MTARHQSLMGSAVPPLIESKQKVKRATKETKGIMNRRETYVPELPGIVEVCSSQWHP